MNWCRTSIHELIPQQLHLILRKGHNCFRALILVRFIVAYLVYGYTGALLPTITISEKTALTPLHISIYLALKGITDRRKHVTMEFINNAMIEIRAKKKANFDQRFTKQLKSNHYKSLQQTFVACSGSFLYRISGLFFALSYGFSQVAAYRWAIGGPIL